MTGHSEFVSAEDWEVFRPGDVVKVVASDGESYVASVEMKTERSDIIWVRRHGLGTRHMLEQLEGAHLQPHIS